MTGIDLTPQIGGSVSGIVTDQDTGLPLAGMPVSLDFNPLPIGYSACTTTDGTYQITGVALDLPFRARAAAAIMDDGTNPCGGAGNYVTEHWEETPNFSEATLITLTGVSPDATDINFTLEVGGSISGEVVDQVTNQPLENISVQLFDPRGEGGLEPFWACTDNQGRYRFPVVPFDVQFSPVAGGSFNFCGGSTSYLEEFWEEHPSGGQQDLVSVTAANPDLTGIDFTLELGGHITGHIYESDGVTPITSGAGVYVAAMDHSFIPGAFVQSDGSYDVPSLPAGDYYVSAGGDGFMTANSTIVTVGVGETVSGIDFSLQRIITISGYVHESDGVTPVSGTVTVVAESDGSPALSAAVNPFDGKYTIYNVPPGDYLIHAEGDGYALEYYLEAGADRNNGTYITAHEGDVITDIDFTLDPGGTISGTVYAATGGLPVSGVNVFVDGTSIAACSDNFGHYSLIGVALDQPVKVFAGGYNACPDSGAAIEEWWQESPDSAGATPITLTSVSPDVSGIDFTLEFALEYFPDPAVMADASAITVDEGDTATNSISLQGNFYDMPQTLKASVGTLTDNGNGTWDVEPRHHRRTRAKPDCHHRLRRWRRSWRALSGW